MHSSRIFASVLALSAVVFAQGSDPCVGQVGSSSNRKIAIAIDSSGSNLDTDPNNLRIAAGQGIVASLGGTDQVAVIDFDYSAAVVSPLGPPSAASFASIDSDGGTCIYCGVEEALTTLQGAAPNTAGIIVLTDGQDSYVTDLIAQIDIATGLGIRVSFGFLSPDIASQDPDIVAAIQRNGGIFANIDTAEAQANFVSLILTSGLVNDDTATGSTLLFPGVRVNGNVSASSSPVSYQYSALANEILNFTVTAVTPGVSFDTSLKKDGNEVKKVTTDIVIGSGSISYTAGSAAENLTLEVSTTNTTDGLYQIALGSSENRTINICGQTPPTNNGTKPNGTATSSRPPTYTPTQSSFPTFTGAANMLKGVVAVAAFPVLFALAL